MKFLYPQFLWALGALSIPLLIHLFNFRRYTTVYFSNTRLLQNVVKQSKSINRLRQILIMLARMLTLAMLVIAFANPYIPAANTVTDSGNHATLYIDNSPSMLSGTGQNTLLNSARSKAVEIIKSLPQNYKVQILTNDFSGRQQRFYNKTEAIDLVDAITPSYAFRESGEIAEKIKQAQEKIDNEPLEIFWISDFQRSAFTENISAPPNWRQSILPLQLENNTGNIAIDSVWFDQPVLQPGFDQELQVQISNSGSDDNKKVSVSLSIDNRQLGAREVQIPANGKIISSFTMRADKAAIFQGEVSINAGNPHFDNSFFFTYSVARPFRILLTGNDHFKEKFSRLFSDSIYHLQYFDIHQIDYSTLSNYDLIILDAPTSVPSGFVQAVKEHEKNIVLIPASESAEAINNVLVNYGLPSFAEKRTEARALEVSWNDPHFKGVFSNTPEKPALPYANEYYPFPATVGYPLVTLENGSPLVSRIPAGNANLFLISSDLEKTNLSDHPIFVPLMLNAVLFSRDNAALYTLSGKSTGPQFEISGNEEIPLHIAVNSESELIPRQRNKNHVIELYNLPSELTPDIYNVFHNDSLLGYVAINPPPRESKWHFLTEDEIMANFNLSSADILEAGAGELGFSISKRYSGTPLWKWFLAGALLFLTLEIVLIKLWK